VPFLLGECIDHFISARRGIASLTKVVSLYGVGARCRHAEFDFSASDFATSIVGNSPLEFQVVERQIFGASFRGIVPDLVDLGDGTGGNGGRDRELVGLQEVGEVLVPKVRVVAKFVSGFNFESVLFTLDSISASVGLSKPFFLKHYPRVDGLTLVPRNAVVNYIGADIGLILVPGDDHLHVVGSRVVVLKYSCKGRLLSRTPCLHGVSQIVWRSGATSG
jgi:hypothetical protein